MTIDTPKIEPDPVPRERLRFFSEIRGGCWMKLSVLCKYLEQFAPLQLAEDWDNVGLLVGDPERSVSSVMTCLTVTPDSVHEALEQSADLIVTHHPIPFRPLTKITADHAPGRLLLPLIESKVAVYSPHTAFDSAREGINRQLAELLQLTDIQPLHPTASATSNEVSLSDSVGAGRMGLLSDPISVEACLQRLKGALHLQHVGLVGDRSRNTQKIAIACGSAGQFLTDAVEHACDMFITGETNFHTCLAAEADNITLVLLGHFASERFAVVSLAEAHIRRIRRPESLGLPIGNGSVAMGLATCIVLFDSGG